MTAGVYAIVNTVNGRAYVGSSVDIERRWSGRRYELNRGQSSNKRLQADWDVVGVSGFELRILEVLEKGDAILLEAENRWIATMTSMCGVYNIRDAAIGRNSDYGNMKQNGWGWAIRRKKAHYFIKRLVPLCEDAAVTRDSHFSLEDGLDDSPSNCKECRAAKDRRAAERRAKWTAYYRTRRAPKEE